MTEDSNRALRNLLKGTSIVYAGLVVEVLIAFLAQIFAAKYLSVGGFGGLITGTAILNVGAILASLGFDQGLIRYLPRLGPRERRAIVRRVMTITLLFSFILGFIISIKAEFIAAEIFGDQSITLSVRVFGAAVPFATMLSIAVGGIRGQKRSLFRVYVENLLRPILRFSLVIVAITYGLGQLGIALAYAIPYVVGAGAAMWLLRRTFSRDRSETADGHFRGLLRYSLPLVFRRMSSFVYRSIDIFLVLVILGSNAVGIYAVAYGLAKLVLMFSTAFNYLSVPIASEFESEGNISGMFDIQRIVIRWIAITSIIGVIPMFLFPAELLSGIYKPAYTPGSGALTVLVLGFAVHNVLSTHANLLEALGRSRALAINGILAASTNIGLNILLIPRYNIVGAAIATVVAYLLLNLVGLVQLWYFTDEFLLPRSIITPVAVGCAVLFIARIVTTLVPPNLPWIVGTSALLMAVYAATVLIVQGFSQEEVMIVRSIEERYGLNLGPIGTLVQRLS